MPAEQDMVRLYLQIWTDQPPSASYNHSAPVAQFLLIYFSLSVISRVYPPFHIRSGSKKIGGGAHHCRASEAVSGGRRLSKNEASATLLQ